MSKEQLTEKQKEIYELYSNGDSIAIIMKKLNKGRGTVRGYLKAIKQKLSDNTITVSHPDNIYTLPDSSEENFLKESNRHLKSKLKKLQKEEAIECRILHLFEKTIKKYPDHKKFNILKKGSSNSKSELVVMLSDIHAGEIVKRSGTLGLNEYNMDVMEQRLKNMFNNINSIVQDSNKKFKKLNVFLLGDMVSGIIHDELKEGISMVDQVFVTASIIAEMIYKWSQIFPQVDVSCVVGNHGRLQKTPHFKNKHDNFDSFLYHAVKIHLKKVQNVNVEVPEGPWLKKYINGKIFILTHGDSRAPGYGGISYYKIDKMDVNMTRTLAYLSDTNIDYLCMAHFHEQAVLSRVGGGKVLVNGSVIGTGDFALYALYKGNDPVQTMFEVHPKYGVNHIDDIRVLD